MTQHKKAAKRTHGWIVGLRVRDTIGPIVESHRNAGREWKSISNTLFEMGHGRYGVGVLKRILSQWEKRCRDGWSPEEQMARDMNGEIEG